MERCKSGFRKGKPLFKLFLEGKIWLLEGVLEGPSFGHLVWENKVFMI
jgi:hypothetical protein